jgi:hypothetical protein
MNADINFDLTPSQWETLKALRTPALERRALDRVALPDLIGLELAVITEKGPMITTKGREVLLRGSPRLWDVAA